MSSIHELLRSVNACLKPWVVVREGRKYVVLYDYVRGVIASIPKESTSNADLTHAVEGALLKLGLASEGCEDTVFADLVPGSPVTYSLEATRVFPVGRVELVIPMGGNEPLQNPYSVPYPCETFVVPDWGITKDDVLPEYVEALARYFRVMKPGSVVLSFGRVDNILSSVIDVAKVFSDVASGYVAEFEVSLYYGDYIKYWGKLSRYFSKAVITCVDDNFEVTDALKQLSGKGEVDKIIILTHTEKASSIFNRLKTLHRLRPLPPTFVIPSDPTADTNLMTQFLTTPLPQEIPILHYGGVAPCKNGNLSFAVEHGNLRIAPCKWDHIHGASTPALENGELSRAALKKALTRWGEVEPCHSCGFRVLCGFCREFIRNVLGNYAVCPVREAFFSVTGISNTQP